MVNGAIARERVGDGPGEEVEAGGREEKALNDSHGIHKFSPALLSSRMPSPCEWMPKSPYVCSRVETKKTKLL